MRDPHNFLRTILLVFTPSAYVMLVGFHTCRVIRDALKKGTR